MKEWNVISVEPEKKATECSQTSGFFSYIYPGGTKKYTASSWLQNYVASYSFSLAQHEKAIRLFHEKYIVKELKKSIIK